MKKIPAARFKADCLSIIEKVRTSGEPVLVTKYGKPIVKLVPWDPDSIFGYMVGRAKIVGDFESPAAPLEDWEVER